MQSARAIRAGAAYIEAFLDEKPFVRGLRSLANRSRQIASQLQIGGLFSTAMGGGMTYFARKVLDIAGHAQEVQNRFNAVFNVVKDGAVVFEGFRQDAEDFANLLALSANRSAFQLKDMMARVQSIVLGFGFARREALMMSKAITRVSLDMASFEDISDEAAITKLLSGLAGEIEPVRRVGLPINQTTLEAELKRMGLPGDAKLATEGQKALARTQIILRSMSESFKNATGDVFRTANTYSNVLRGLAGAWYDFQVAVGGTIVAIASTWATRVTLMLRNAERFIKSYSGLVRLIFLSGVALAVIGPMMLAASVALRMFAYWANITANVLTFLQFNATRLLTLSLAPVFLAWRVTAAATLAPLRLVSLALRIIGMSGGFAIGTLMAINRFSPTRLITGLARAGGSMFLLARSVLVNSIVFRGFAATIRLATVAGRAFAITAVAFYNATLLMARGAQAIGILAIIPRLAVLSLAGLLRLTQGVVIVGHQFAIFATRVYRGHNIIVNTILRMASYGIAAYLRFTGIANTAVTSFARTQGAVFTLLLRTFRIFLTALAFGGTSFVAFARYAFIINRVIRTFHRTLGMTAMIALRAGIAINALGLRIIAFSARVVPAMLRFATSLSGPLTRPIVFAAHTIGRAFAAMAGIVGTVLARIGQMLAVNSLHLVAIPAMLARIAAGWVLIGARAAASIGVLAAYTGLMISLRVAMTAISALSLGPILIVGGAIYAIGAGIARWVSSLSMFQRKAKEVAKEDVFEAPKQESKPKPVEAQESTYDKLKDKVSQVAGTVRTKTSEIAANTVKAAGQVPGMAAKAWGAIRNAAGQAATFIKSHYVEVRDRVLDTFNTIRTAFLAGDLQLAAQVAFVSLQIVWFDMLTAMFDNLDEWRLTVILAFNNVQTQLEIIWNTMKGFWRDFTLGLTYYWLTFVSRIVAEFEIGISKMQVAASRLRLDPQALKNAQRQQREDERKARERQSGRDKKAGDERNRPLEAKDGIEDPDDIRRRGTRRHKDIITSRDEEEFTDEAERMRKMAEALREKFEGLRGEASNRMTTAAQQRELAEKEFLRKHGGSELPGFGDKTSGALKTLGTVSGRDAQQMFRQTAIPVQQLSELKRISAELKRMRMMQNLQDHPGKMKWVAPVVN